MFRVCAVPRLFIAATIVLKLAVVANSQTTTPALNAKPDLATTEMTATVAPSPAASSSAPPQRLSLNTAMNSLIENNLVVVAARYGIDIQRAQRIAAGLRPTPSITFSATQFAIPSVLRHPASLVKTNTVNGAANTTYTIEVDQLIDRGGKRALRASQADFSTQAAEAQLRDTLRQQIFQLKQAYFTAVLSRENLHVAEENLEHFDHTERILAVQVKEGYSAGVDLKRMELQQLQFKRDVASAEQSYQQSLRDIFNLTGAGDAPSSAESTQIIKVSSMSNTPDINADLEVVDGKLEIIPTLLWINDLRRMALANRPDVKAAELALEAAKQGRALAFAGRTRDVTVGGQFSRNGSDNTVGVILSVPLGINRRADAAIAQATAAQLQAEAQLRQVKTQALTDIEKAFTTYRLSRERLRLFTGSALRTASDVRRIEEIAYRDGAKGLLDYLDAQRTFNQTQLDYNQARYDFLMSLYQLEYATASDIVERASETK